MVRNGKTVCIVQARTGSSRLPGKVMMRVLGEPMISYTLKRLKKCETIDEVVLATSELAADSELAAFVESIGFECFRGSEDDVLERYVLCNRKYGGETVIRVTGDCPLIDPGLVDLTVRAFRESDVDYMNLNKTIRGLDTEVFTAEALERAYDAVSRLEDFENYKEHVTIYMYKHPEDFKTGSVSTDEGLNRPYRLCVDQIEDFKVIQAVYRHFNDTYTSIQDVVGFLDKNPETAFLNKDVTQKKA